MQMSYMEKVCEFLNIPVGIESTRNTQKRIIHITGKGLNNTVNKVMIVLYMVFTLGFSIAGMSQNILVKHAFKGNNTIRSILQFLTKPQIVVIALLVTYLVVYIKIKLLYHINEGKNSNIDIYRRDLPSTLRPAHVRMLLNDGQVDSVSLAATLLDLIDKGYLGLKKENRVVNNVDKLEIFEQNSKEIIIFKQENKDYNKLFKFEKFVIEWFIDKNGDGKEVSSKELRESLKNIKEAKDFELFQAYVLISFPFDKFYKKIQHSNRYKILMGIGIFIGALLAMGGTIGTVILTYCMGMAFFGMPGYVLNDRGANEKDMWLDLKIFLIDFSLIEDKPTEMVIIWNFYLTYSIVLDISKVAVKEMQDFFGEEIYYTENPVTDLKYYDEKGHEKQWTINYKLVLNPKNKEVLQEVINDAETEKRIYEYYNL